MSQVGKIGLWLNSFSRLNRFQTKMQLQNRYAENESDDDIGPCVSFTPERYILTYIHSYIHTYIHTYIHIYIYIYIYMVTTSPETPLSHLNLKRV